MADVVTLVRDLLFASKIREAAAGAGATVESARTPEAVAAAAARGARLVILDLRLPEAMGALAALRADPVAGGVVTVGFVDHEKTDVMEVARAGGCDEVLAKGAFASRLPALIPR